jgi:hypothetical protein
MITPKNLMRIANTYCSGISKEIFGEQVQIFRKK